jgi:hypothetical protein
MAGGHQRTSGGLPVLSVFLAQVYVRPRVCTDELASLRLTASAEAADDQDTASSACRRLLNPDLSGLSRFSG